MYEFWYEYIKLKYGENEKLCYMDTDNIYKDVETRFDASNFEINRPLPKAKNKKVIGIIKEELVGQVMKEFVAIRAKTYSYLTDNNDEDKKAKITQKYVIKKQT